MALPKLMSYAGAAAPGSSSGFDWKRFGGEALTDLGAGLTRGKDWQDALRIANEQSEQLTPQRAVLQQQSEEKAKRQAEITATFKYLQDKFPDLAQAVSAGAMTPGEAWGESLRLSRPDLMVAPAGSTIMDRNNLNAGGTVIPDPAGDAAASMAAGKEAFDRNSALWKEYGGADAVKTYEAVKGGYQRVQEGATQDNGAGDMALIYGFMKMNDPGSVVRESEFQMAAQSGSLPEQIQGLVNQVLTGGRLAPGVRQRMVEAARGLYQQTSNDMTDFNTQFGGRATGFGVDPSTILRMPEAYDPFTAIDSRVTADDPLGIL